MPAARGPTPWTGTGILKAGNLDIGQAGSGTFNQTGGSNNFSGFLTLGSFVGSNGTYSLSGATSTLDTHEPTIGSFGTGLFQQSGGTLEFPTAGSRLIVGEAGSGFFTQTGGTINAVSAPGNLDIILGNKATGNGTYTLEGATSILKAGNLTIGKAATALSLKPAAPTR